MVVAEEDLEEAEADLAGKGEEGLEVVEGVDLEEEVDLAVLVVAVEVALVGMEKNSVKMVQAVLVVGMAVDPGMVEQVLEEVLVVLVTAVVEVDLEGDSVQVAVLEEVLVEQILVPMMVQKKLSK